MKKQNIKKILKPKKSDYDRMLWDGGTTDKVLTVIAVLILFGIFTFLIASFASM